MKRKKIWVGLSSVVLSTSPAALASAAGARSEQPPVLIAQGPSHGEGSARAAQVQGHGGEAGERGRSPARASGESGGARRAPRATAGGEGESGEGAAANRATASAQLPANLRLHRDLQLTRGHLLVGSDLAQAGDWDKALPHLLHPQKELHGRMMGPLKALKAPPLLPALKALAQAAKARNKDAVASAVGQVEERLAAAETALQAKEANWPLFALESLVEVLQTAAEEYEEGVKDGKVVNAVEYQDARGFVLAADRLFQSLADPLGRKDAAATDAIRAALNDLKTSWPSAATAEASPKDPGAVLANVSRIELQLTRFR